MKSLKILFTIVLLVEIGKPNLFIRAQSGSDDDSDEDIENQTDFPWNPRWHFVSPLQSPIDVVRCNCREMEYEPLIWNYAPSVEKDGIALKISNTGHGVSIKIPSEEARPFLSGGMLPGRYLFDNLHLHWGRTDDVGSEHFVDGESYAMECHMVTYNSKYSDLNEALNHKDDGVVVFTFFFKLTPNNNEDLQPFLRYVLFIRETGYNITALDQDALIWFLNPLEVNDEYLTYPGSLTTPPYTESVVFIILPEPIRVSSHQLSVMRRLMDNHVPSRPVLDNRRVIQPVNHRPVVCVKGAVEWNMRY
ncbi:carbonic anhydrase 13 [Nilaparvata lugens]|uniref:Seminal fluid protein n=1 Tax=Nilaparvata lugens TaxID=108931 RepID=A0A1I9WL36_NILLU|nr:carbonic anhydrase 13 [Nilaparvata lugens]XP_039290785.1 carbonic anhydrase 13 [Nilaparvata lugens]XP_039290786.1 carbonic anhydrase 13 [Nilaparvata lugens]XP_039290787.1 carbonic anhydrase 13 [Nilaparvata lugens]APA33856.1 seminal fluid protein [Nilaparvata lugens]